ncbi:Ubiquitin-conjugating enzyme E2 4 [Modicella reniformis]|uniref:Ubiquitin-conjugating enzyme E2 4 n=1 Tax=Modicella reniformis TaxID=1440133 RepID=A0A9P6MGG1_9FUNG|nr:Ubiquitin-conjugating enzyme E2 4 [Modicella reniformis]
MTQGTALRRINQELPLISQDPLGSCLLVLPEATCPNSKAVSRVLILAIVFPSNYPTKPPKVTFTTKTYHPNIDAKGNIQLDILDAKWKPDVTIAGLLMTIGNLLIEIANVYKTDCVKYEQTAREWTRKHTSISCQHTLDARTPPPDDDQAPR